MEQKLVLIASNSLDSTQRPCIAVVNPPLVSQSVSQNQNTHSEPKHNKCKDKDLSTSPSPYSSHIASSITKQNAILVSYNKILDEDICTIRWDNYWGFIIFDYKGRVKIHGPGFSTSANIELSFAGQTSFPINWDVAKTNQNDIVIVRPSGGSFKQINVFSAKKINEVIFKEMPCIYMNRDKVDSLTVYYDDHMTIQGSYEHLHNMADFLNQRFMFLHEQVLPDLIIKDQILSRAQCVCFVKFSDHLLMVVGHRDGYISVWKLPVHKIDITDSKYHIIQVKSGYDCVKEADSAESIKTRNIKIHGVKKNPWC